MKCITLIVHASAKSALTDFFHEIAEVRRFTMIDCEGYDENDLADPRISPGDRVVGYIPRVRMDLAVNDPDVTTVMTKLRATESQVSGLGIYWITPIEDEGIL
jgi:nitrogen regulatory protein PII